MYQIQQHFLNYFYLWLLVVFCSANSNAQNWNWQNPLPQGANLYSVYFANANTGYSVGFDGVILKTTDAGVSWTQQISGTSSSLLAVHFVNTDTGYAVGQSAPLLKTTDGGNTWVSLPTPSVYLGAVFLPVPILAMPLEAMAAQPEL